ncbi:MAG: pyridoxamine 5'-phosphate oxidase [Gammaproteobacteria bacterium]|nr:pyridoxamine 5'-phosphate oxidase [Gammaproteobacteria bacterium]
MNDLHDSLPANPIAKLERWLAEARQRRDTPNSNAMCLATVDQQKGELMPSARVVLCKQVDTESGFIVFFTNYDSRKAAELEQNPVAAATFHWDALGRQIRLEGRVVKSPASESDAYFASRARGSQLGAWASDQSQPIASRVALLQQLDKVTERFADTETIPRPPHWGGYRLWVSAAEIWIEGDHRVHDRARWVRTLGVDDHGDVHPDDWTVVRLQP